MFATLNSPIHHAASHSVSTHDVKPAILASTRRHTKKVGGLVTSDACAALSALALALSFSFYTIGHIGGHRQHGAHAATHVETRVASR